MANVNIQCASLFLKDLDCGVLVDIHSKMKGCWPFDMLYGVRIVLLFFLTFFSTLLSLSLAVQVTMLKAAVEHILSQFAYHRNCSVVSAHQIMSLN